MKKPKEIDPELVQRRLAMIARHQKRLDLARKEVKDRQEGWYWSWLMAQEAGVSRATIAEATGMSLQYVGQMISRQRALMDTDEPLIFDSDSEWEVFTAGDGMPSIRRRQNQIGPTIGSDNAH